jgi:hypothetical protein
MHRLRIALRVLLQLVGLVSIVLQIIAEAIDDLTARLDHAISRLSRGHCRRHGHRMGPWLLGWRWCEWCDHREQMEARR